MTTCCRRWTWCLAVAGLLLASLAGCSDERDWDGNQPLLWDVGPDADVADAGDAGAPSFCEEHPNAPECQPAEGEGEGSAEGEGEGPAEGEGEGPAEGEGEGEGPAEGEGEGPAEGEGEGPAEGEGEGEGPPCIPAAEVCNGVDDDCNGATDEGLQVLAGAELRVTDDPNHSTAPSLVWDGEHYGVAWTDSRDGDSTEIYFNGVLADGRLSGAADRRITNAPDSSNSPVLVWAGGVWGLVWRDSRDDDKPVTYFARLAADGQRLGGELALLNRGESHHQPALVWKGDGFGVAWQGLRQDVRTIYAAQLGAGGALVGEPTAVAEDVRDPRDGPALAWSGAELALVWSTNPNEGLHGIWFARVAANGALIGDTVRVTGDGCRQPEHMELLWNGQEYGLVWSDIRDLNREIYFVRLSREGNVLRGDVRITHANRVSDEPSLLWDGLEWRLAWRDERNGGGGSDVYVTRITPAGDRVGPDVRITNGAGLARGPSLAWTGSELGVAWSDNRHDRKKEIYFARGPFGCPRP